MIQFLRFLRAAVGSDRDLLGRYICEGDEQGLHRTGPQVRLGCWGSLT